MGQLSLLRDELVAGNLEDSYVAECRIFYEGYVGHHSDD
jgi:hypothetical protein